MVQDDIKGTVAQNNVFFQPQSAESISECKTGSTSKQIGYISRRSLSDVIISIWTL